MRKSLRRQDLHQADRGAGLILPGRKAHSQAKERAPDYRRYSLSVRERLVCLAQGIALLAVLAWFFYRTFWAMLPLMPILVFLFRKTNETLARKRRKELSVQFKDAILSVASGLQAGYSVENAFLEAGRDTQRLYGKDSLMALELDRIQKGLRSSVPLEVLLGDLGSRSGEADIEDFTEVFSIAKRMGGNMNEIIRQSAAVTAEKMEVKREIQTLLSSRRYEQKIMNLIPFLIMAYLQFASPGFFDVLYGSLPGAAIMTAALAVYLASYEISERIVDIEV